MRSARCKFVTSSEHPNQFQNGDFHHTLVEVCWFILHHLDGDDLVRCDILAFHHLTEGTLAQNVQNEVPATRKYITVSPEGHVHALGFIVTQPIIHVKNVIVIHVVVPIIMRGLTRFR